MSGVQESQQRDYLVIGMWVVLAVLVGLFVLHNLQSIELDIAFTTVSLPLWIFVVLVFAVGVAAGWATHWWRRRR